MDGGNNKTRHAPPEWKIWAGLETSLNFAAVALGREAARKTSLAGRRGPAGPDFTVRTKEKT